MRGLVLRFGEPESWSGIGAGGRREVQTEVGRLADLAP